MSEMENPKISVIVAIYNVESYIEKCIRSLFEQTLEDVEYIFVNDCTPDNSIFILRKVLEEYPNRRANTKIIDLEKNSGVANARTIGMKSATGEYMIHCDPDDYCELNYFEVLYNEACKTNTDIVVCDYYRERKNSVEYMAQHYDSTPQKSIRNFYKCAFFPSLWTTLIKTSIIQENQIYPYTNINTGEDLNVIFRVFLKAQTLSYVNSAFYHYLQREDSLTQNRNIKELWDNNISPNLNYLSYILDSQNCNGSYERTKHYLQYSKKLMLLQCSNPYWQLWYNEFKDCINSLAYFQGFSPKHKYVMKLFGRHYILLALYYRILRPIGLKII